MHLAINATELGRGRGGNETYIAGLIQGLSQLRAPPDTTLLICEWEADLRLPSPFGKINLGAYRRLPFFVWQQTMALRRVAADWYLSNYYLPPLLPCKGAVVVHDLSFRAHPEFFPLAVAWYMRWLVGRAVRAADRVVTVSNFSREELLRFYPQAEGKVRVVPNGIGAAFKPREDDGAVHADRQAVARYGVEQAYILAVGNIHRRKNLSRLLDAYVDLRRKRDRIPQMVWVGAPRWGTDQLLKRARTVGVVLTGFVAEEDLPAFYRQAEMLAYPSLYEGFGLPPLEAMACGTPVVTSNTTSLPEVVGEAALTVDPTDVEAIASAMARLLDDQTLREELTRAGIDRAQRYTWQRAARQLLAALQ